MTRQRRRNIIRTRRTGTGIALVAVISFLAGMTDAIGLRMSGDFVSFMTGNTTRAAMSFEAGNYMHGLVLLGAILIFVIGNALGVVAAHLSRRRVFTILACVSILLAVASMLRTPQLALAQFYLVVLAMGMVNAAVEHIEGLPIGLTYVTGALSRFGRGLGRWFLGDRRIDWTIQLVPWIGMMVGAVCGAILGGIWQSDALWVVAIITLICALTTMLIPRSLQHRYNHKVPISRTPRRRR